MIVLGILAGFFTGQMQEVGNASIQSAKEAVELCITMLGVMSLWCGLMEIAKQSGLIASMTKKLMPVIHFLFPGVPKGHSANEYIAANIMANILGLGWAATPVGLKAMQELAAIKRETENGRKYKHTATADMCTFLILNISSLQLIPVNIIAYRSQYNSPNPTVIVAPAIAATTISTLAAVIFCKIMAHKKQ